MSNNNKASIHRLSTGVPGLDKVLGGGLPEFSFNLIAGTPGSGKTTLAHQIMFALATPERPALYFTVLGEPPLKMLRYQQQFSFFDETALNQRIRFINLSEVAMTGDLDRVLQRIVSDVAKYSPGLVFVDSFRSIVVASEGLPMVSLAHFVQQLGMVMTSWQATTFLLGEYFNENDANPVFTVADGLIWLRQSVQRNSMVRKLEIMKMRGQPTLPGLHSFRIGPEGLRVFAAAQRPALDHAAITLLPGRALLGLPALDAMLGGGLPRGHSLLVAGPSGSGKSILAALFLAAGVHAGEQGVAAAFEQQPHPRRNPLLMDLVAGGDVGLIDSRQSDLSIDEVTALILDEVRRRQATRVVLDSLSGFELALAPTFRPDFRESLLGLVSVLANEGVTVLMTSELEDRYTDLRFSPYGAAFLTDAIIVQRYVEVDSRLLRMMAVVKVRNSMHSDEMRAYSIDDSGICMGDSMPDLTGLLGGRPTRLPGTVAGLDVVPIPDGPLNHPQSSS